MKCARGNTYIRTHGQTQKSTVKVPNTTVIGQKINSTSNKAHKEILQGHLDYQLIQGVVYLRVLKILIRIH